MKQSLLHVTLVVRDYDEAIAFFTKKLGFTLVEDIYQPEQGKRWVVVRPPGSNGTSLVLGRPSQPGQEAFIGDQTGGRVTFFLGTDDFWRDYNNMVAEGIEFVREPKEEAYGTVAVFKDLYGNQWDLLELRINRSIDQLLDLIDEAYQHRDAKVLANLYHTNAKYPLPTGGIATGPEQIEEHLPVLFDMVPDDVKTETIARHVDMVTPALAIVDLKVQNYRRLGDGWEPVSIEGFTFVLTCENGQWLIVGMRGALVPK